MMPSSLIHHRTETHHSGRLSTGGAPPASTSQIGPQLHRQGVIAEGLTIDLTIPADTTVVAATGTGYQGTHTDDKTKATVATWKLPRSAPKDEQKLSITLSKPATAAANLRGDIHWTKPSPKNGPSTDVVNIAPAPL